MAALLEGDRNGVAPLPRAFGSERGHPPDFLNKALPDSEPHGEGGRRRSLEARLGGSQTGSDCCTVAALADIDPADTAPGTDWDKAADHSLAGDIAAGCSNPAVAEACCLLG